MRSTFTVFASAVEASIKGYATRKLRCGWAINKRGRKAYTTFTLRQNAACANILFFICWVDYALEGSTFSLSKCDFLSCAHYFQAPATQASLTYKAREKRPGHEVAFSAYSRKTLLRVNRVKRRLNYWAELLFLSNRIFECEHPYQAHGY